MHVVATPTAWFIVRVVLLVVLWPLESGSGTSLSHPPFTLDTNVGLGQHCLPKVSNGFKVLEHLGKGTPNATYMYV